MEIYKQIAWYAGEIYGEVKLTYSPNKDILFIKTPWDYFKIYLNDKLRFGYYTIMHQNRYNENWHKQKKCNSLNFAVYMCAIHGFYKENNLYSEFGEFDKFTNDAIKAWKYKERIDNEC